MLNINNVYTIADKYLFAKVVRKMIKSHLIMFGQLSIALFLSDKPDHHQLSDSETQYNITLCQPTFGVQPREANGS